MSNPNDSTSQDRRNSFAELYQGCADWLYCYLLSLLRRPGDAEEVLQEAAGLMWEKFDQYRPDTEFRAWACRIAHFKALKFQERQRRKPLAVTDLFFESIEEEAIVMADGLDARMDALGDCVSKLLPKERQLIEMRYTTDLAVADMAHRCRQSVHAVYRRLAKIRQSLSQCVERTLSQGST